MHSCVRKILSFLQEPVIRHGAYVIQYKDKVQLLEQENKKLREIKMRIQRKVDRATNNGEVIVTDVSSWLEEAKQMKRDIANFLRQRENGEQMEEDFANFLRQRENGEQMERDFANFLRQRENGEQMERDIANFLRQQENGEQMERDFANFRRQQGNREQMERDIANFLRQQENGEQMERDFANFPRQQENGEQMEGDFANFMRQQENGEQMGRDFANFLRQQENGESFECLPGFMCPNLMWRHKRGMEADKKKSNVTELISKGERLEGVPVAHNASIPLELHFDSSQYYTEFQSRASVFLEIMNALKDSRVDMIGVHGPGGAGKTTMVKEVAKEAKKLGIFDEIAIAVVTKDPNTSQLQEDLVKQLDLSTSEDRKAVLGNALLNGKRKILVILDDLWQVLDLKAIGILISGLGDKCCKNYLQKKKDNCCKIMLTSRKEGVLEAMLQEMEVRPLFFIDYLKEQEPWELFTKVTGNFVVDERIGDCRVDGRIAREVCKKCAHLPIAIVAVAAALRPREEVAWQNALLELEESPLKHIEGIEGVEQKGYKPLKWSYDFLQHEGAKSCFLLCCLFPEDAEISIDDLVRYSFALGFLGKKANTLQHARTKVETMVGELKRSCMLLNGAQENFVKMHDVFRDLAIFITREKQAEDSSGQDWPRRQQFMVDHNFQELPENEAWEHHTAISLRINDKFSFPRGVLHCPPMHTLVLKSEKYSLKIPNDFIQGRKAPRVLDFENISLDFRSPVFELNDLRMLSLKYPKLLGELSTIRYLKNLKIFIFEDIEIKKLPQEIGELTHLQVLDLRCKKLEVIPKGVISKLRNLEELYVGCGFMKWDTDTTVDGGEMSNASISELKSLDKLTSLHVRISTKSFKIMVQEFLDSFMKLSKFSIFINDFWGGAPNVLKIDGRDGTGEGLCPLIKKVDPLMEKVDMLTLTCIPNLIYLPGQQQLQITSSGGGFFRKLTELDISGCHSMKYIFSPSCARELQQLRRLEVFDCGEMEQIIGVADNYHGEEVVSDEAIIFRQLRILHLQELPRFRSFYPKIGKNSSNWTTSAESIFNEKVFFPILEELTIWKFSNDIWKQVIQSPNGSNNVSFSQLKNVIIAGCENLLQITSSGGGSFRQLTELYIGKCHSIKYIFSPSHARELQQLQRLEVFGCREMEQIIGVADNYHGEEVVIDEAIIFNQLRILNLQDLPRFRSFCPKIEGNPSNWTTTAESIFNEKVSFPSLENLTIEELPVKHIWNEQMIQSPNQLNNISFSQLKEVDIYKCENLENVFPSNMLSQLQNLENLRVRQCHSLTLVVEGLNLNGESRTMKSSYSGVFPKLEVLEFFW